MDSVHPISSRLKEAREARNLSITELSKLSNIRIHIIQALDEGRLEELPKVYMRSFIKRYAQCVGISSQEIEDLMNKSLASPAAPSTLASLQNNAINAVRGMKAPIVVGPNKNRRRLLTIMYSLLGLCGIGGLYYLYAPSHTPIVAKAPLAPSVVISDKDSAGAATNGGLLNYFGIATADSVVLEAVTSDTVWLNITADGKSTEQLTLMPHQNKRWVAAEKFLLSVGNAGGIKLKRNGQDLPALGKLGETVRSIRITHSEFVTSASPWKSQRDTVRKVVPPVKPTLPEKSPAKTQTKLYDDGRPATPTANTHTVQHETHTTSASTSAHPATLTAPKSPSALSTQHGATQTPTSVKSSTSTTGSAQQSVALTKPVLSAKQRLELAEKKKRLERIRQAARSTEITPVPIK